MEPSFYKILHFVGIFAMLLGIVGMILNKSILKDNPFQKKTFAILHGLGLVVVLVAGFGLLAKLELGMPGWAIAKLGLWLTLGAIPVASRFLAPMATVWLALGVASVAAYLATTKPF